MNPEQESNSKQPFSLKEKLKSKPFLAAAALATALLISLVAALLIGQDETGDQSQAPPTAQISITKKGFSPAFIAVKKGTKIVWTNADSKIHQIQANPHPSGDSLPGLKSEILNNKQTYEYTADTTGTFGYHDHLNPTTNGTIEVQE